MLLFLCLLSITGTLIAQESRFSLRLESNVGYSDRTFVNDGTVPDM